MNSTPRTTAFLLTLLLAWSSHGVSEETHFGARIPTVDEFVNGLKPEQRPLRFRGIRPVVATGQLDPAETQAAAVDSLSSPTVTMELTFAFDSYQLSPAAKRVLDTLSAALQRDELADYTFLVEGHTDAVGHAAYNLSLSEKRAMAVQSYLVLEHGIALDRIKMQGKGESELLDSEHPESGANRRVAIVNLGEQAR